jgi:hypothetical protein
LLLNVHPGTSDQSFGDIFIEHFQRHFYLAWFFVQDVCIHHY